MAIFDVYDRVRILDEQKGRIIKVENIMGDVFYYVLMDDTHEVKIIAEEADIEFIH